MTKTGKTPGLYISPDPRIGDLICQLQAATFTSRFTLSLEVTLPEGFANEMPGRNALISFYNVTVNDGAFVEFMATVKLLRLKTGKADWSRKDAKLVPKHYQLIGVMARGGGWNGSAEIRRIREIKPE